MQPSSSTESIWSMEKKEDGNSAPCPLFATTHCPNIKRGCHFHHNTPTYSQGRACGTRTCQLRHPPDCQLFLQGWCGYVSKEGVPKRYKFCSYFHPAHISQIPPTSVVKSQNARDDARRETREEAALLVQGGESTPPPSTYW